MSLEHELCELIRRIVRDEVRGALLEHAVPTVPQPDQWMTIAEAARYMRAHPSTVRRLIRVHGSGRLQRVRRSDVDNFFNNKPDAAAVDLELLARQVRQPRH